jgi:choice-of-anchor B domain-containing protein
MKNAVLALAFTFTLAPNLAAARAEAGTAQLALLSNLTNIQLGTSRLSDCWGYTSPSGREYALVCRQNGMAFVEVTTPTAPVIVATFGGPTSNWYDAKVFEDHAYAVSEGGGGIQIFDLSEIDSGNVTQLTSVTTPGTTSTHNIAINEDSGFLYRCGGGSEGLRVYDLNQSKSNPPYVGSWSQKYVHDAQIVSYTSGPLAGKELAFTLNGGSTSGLTIVDVTNKGSMSIVDTVNWTQMSVSHQGWIDENKQYFYANDEGDESGFGLFTTTIVIDVSDPFNAFVANKFDNGNTAISHNAYVIDNLLYAANDSSGLRVFDLSVSKLSPPETTFFDTFPAHNNPTFEGLWSCYPLFPSRTIIGSDRTGGLFVWSNEPAQVGFQLLVTPPPFVQQNGQVLPISVFELVPGALVPGTETLHYREGAEWKSAPLVNTGGTTYEGQLPNLTCGAKLRYYFSADSTNGLTWKEPSAGKQDPYVSLVASASVEVFADDFEQDLGWLAENVGATDGDFERGVPVNDPNWPFDPEADADGSGQCYVTDNSLGNSDVDNGKVRLVSPSLDFTGPNVVIQYDYYLNLTDEGGIDEMAVKVNDNVGSGWVTVANHVTSGGTDWRRGYLLGSDLTSAGLSLTSNTLVRFIVNDDDPQSTVEAGVDGFKVLNLLCSPVTSYCTPGTTASGCQVGLSTTGIPSLSAASGFTITGDDGEGSKDGLFFFGQNGRQANPWGGSTSFQCVVPPVQRTPLISGVGSNGNCDGTWAFDLNTWTAANPAKAPAAGTPTQLQFWFRDPQNTSNQTTSLSDAVEFQMAP